MWRPLLIGEQRERAIGVMRELVTVVETSEPRDVIGHADRAVMRAELARADVVADPDDESGAALSRAVAMLMKSRQMHGLFCGTAGIGWAVARLAQGEVAQLVCARVDAALERAVDDDNAHYDLIAGITGFGVYALARGDAGRPLATRVVRALARRARPRPIGIAWHTAPALLPPAQREQAPEGYWNLGVAHGTPGVVAFLARCIAAGIERELAMTLLEGAVAFLHAVGGNGYAGWIAGAADGTDTEGTPSRALAWCYHDLGVAMALLSAATVTARTRWHDEALALARDCARRSDAEARIRASTLCHGATGAAHMFLRLHHATGEALFADAARHWFERALAMGPPRAEEETAEEAALERLDPSLLSGAAGVALALHAAIDDVEPTWDEPMLLGLVTPR